MKMAGYGGPKLRRTILQEFFKNILVGLNSYDLAERNGV